MISSHIDFAVSTFGPSASAAFDGRGLMPRKWTDQNWASLFQFTTARKVKVGEALIRSGEAQQTLFFVLSGRLEAIIQSTDGSSMGSVSQSGAGAIVGELSFFDGGKRAASVWAIQDSEVAAMEPDQYDAFKTAHPDLVVDLLFGLGRLLATRLRSTNARLSG